MQTRKKQFDLTLKIKNFVFGKSLFIIIMLAPMIFHLVLFWGGVQFESIELAFVDEKGRFTLKWFEFVINSIAARGGDAQIAKIIPQAIKNTFTFFLVNMAQVPLQIFTAYLINKKMIGYKFVRAFLWMPPALASLLLTIMFQQLLMVDGPLLTLLKGKWHLNIATPLIMNYPMQVIIFHDVWKSLGSGLILWLGAMGRIPDELKEAAWMDGITPIKEFVYIYFPLIWPTFTTFITLQIVGILGSEGSVFLFTEGNYGTWTLSYWLFHVVYKGQLNSYGIAAALGIMMTIVTIPLVVAGRLFINRFGGEVEY